MKEKKIVDLIYIEPQKDEKTVIKELTFSIEYWKQNLKNMQELYFERHYDSTSPDVLEVLSMRKFLGKFLQNRLEWIADSVKDNDLRKKYLKVLPPFPQKGGLKTLFLHFFQVIESQDKKGLIFQAKSDDEKEISILWDIYKLRRTIESIDTIKQALDQTDTFPSIKTVDERKNCLDSLKAAFQLMFQMCVRREFQKELYQNISPKHISVEALLERKEKEIFYVYSHVIKKYDYRNHFFYVYFFPGMKAKIGGEIKKFQFNYLDFEIIKQEFLIDWLNKKLENNSLKQEVYSRYNIGGKRLDQIIEEDPSKEIEILQQLPISAFNDITAEVNEEVAEELKTSVESFSENKGEFAEATKTIEQTKKTARFSLKKLREFVSRKQKANNEKPAPIPQEEISEPLPEPPPQKETTFDIIKIKKNQIDFPYFQKETPNFKQKLALLRVKMGEKNFTEFSKTLSNFFANVSDSAVIRRRTPSHEITFPQLIKENCGGQTIRHLLILGAEVKSKQLGMAYGAKTGESAFTFTCFFIYGCELPDPLMGEVIDKRNAMGVEFNIYGFANNYVQEKALEFYNMVMKKHK